MLSQDENSEFEDRQIETSDLHRVPKKEVYSRSWNVCVSLN
jgi:hypothetical protein